MFVFIVGFGIKSATVLPFTKSFSLQGDSQKSPVCKTKIVYVSIF